MSLFTESDTVVAEQLARAQNVEDLGADFIRRQILIVGFIDDVALRRFTSAFQVMDEYSGEIRVLLSSEGGEEASGAAIYGMLSQSRNHIVVEGRGAVQSIAALILQAGRERLLSFEARFMVHRGSMELGELDQGSLAAMGRDCEDSTAFYVNEIARRSGLSRKRVRKLVDRNAYMSAAEAVNLGLADAVIRRKHR